MDARFMQALLLLATVCNVNGQIKMKREKYMPYEATSHVLDATNDVKHVVLGGTYKKPDDEVFIKHLDRALRMAEGEVHRIRYMLAKGMVKKNYWNGLYTGSVIVKDEKTVYNFSLGASGNKVGQVNKTVFEDEPYGKMVNNKRCTLMFHEKDGSISSFSCGQGSNKISLSFYPDFSLASCGLAFDGMYNRAKWTEGGKLIHQNRVEWKSEKDENNKTDSRKGETR